MKYRPVRALGALAVALALISPVFAFADHEQNVSQGMTLAGAPLAIHGYDTVAFHTEGAAMLGSAKYSATHRGAAYRFVSEENKKLFERNPDQYLPRFGGFCAYGVAVGAKFDGDPRVFEIVDGALYFNLDPEIQKTWREDVAGNIDKADANWKQIQHRAPGDLK